jgi:hypothetical protein
MPDYAGMGRVHPLRAEVPRKEQYVLRLISPLTGYRASLGCAGTELITGEPEQQRPRLPLIRAEQFRHRNAHEILCLIVL